MKNRPHSSLFCAVIAVFIAISIARAQDAPGEAPAETRAALFHARNTDPYLYRPDDLHRWEVGGVYNHIQREVEIGDRQLNAKDTRWLAHVGFDLLRWLTLYGEGGMNEFSQATSHNEDKSDWDSTWAVGSDFRLFEYWFLDPYMFTDNLTVDARTEYMRFDTEFENADLDWQQFTAWITLGLVNEVDRTRGSSPVAVRIFAGPIYSGVDGSHDIHGEPELSEDQSVGIFGGLEVKINRYMYLSWDGQVYDQKLTHNVGLLARF